MTTPDLEYRNDGMFVRFYANSKDDELAWKEMAKNDGVAAVLNFEAPRIIAQLRKAGYTVSKAKKDKQSADDILNELLS